METYDRISPEKVKFASKMAADSNLLEQKLRQKGAGGPPLRFGATLTIGQYILPAVVAEVLEARPTLALTMLVENTQQLLDKLEHPMDYPGYQSRPFSGFGSDFAFQFYVNRS